MAASAAPIVGTSLASLGLKAGADVAAGEATQQQDNVKAINAQYQGIQQQSQFAVQSSQDLMHAGENETAAEFGKLQATLTDAAARENLTKTLGNISVTRAAGGADLTSPTTAALEGHVTNIADINREASEASINTQTAMEKASADYERQASAYALIQGNAAAGMGQFNANADVAAGNTSASMGWFNAATDILGGLGKAFAGLPGSPGAAVTMGLDGLEAIH
jgi:hypothetical protein